MGYTTPSEDVKLLLKSLREIKAVTPTLHDDRIRKFESRHSGPGYDLQKDWAYRLSQVSQELSRTPQPGDEWPKINSEQFEFMRDFQKIRTALPSEYPNGTGEEYRDSFRNALGALDAIHTHIQNGRINGPDDFARVVREAHKELLLDKPKHERVAQIFPTGLPD